VSAGLGLIAFLAFVRIPEQWSSAVARTAAVFCFSALYFEARSHASAAVHPDSWLRTHHSRVSTVRLQVTREFDDLRRKVEISRQNYDYFLSTIYLRKAPAVVLEEVRRNADAWKRGVPDGEILRIIEWMEDLV
jgi:hypothetical protein